MHRSPKIAAASARRALFFFPVLPPEYLRLQDQISADLPLDRIGQWHGAQIFVLAPFGGLCLHVNDINSIAQILADNRQGYVLDFAQLIAGITFGIKLQSAVERDVVEGSRQWIETKAFADRIVIIDALMFAELGEIALDKDLLHNRARIWH
jgi:hypothetical protein